MESIEAQRLPVSLPWFRNVPRPITLCARPSGQIPYAHVGGDSKPGERWTVRETNGETVMLGRDGKVRQFRPSAKGKWDVLVPSTMQVSVTSSR